MSYIADIVLLALLSGFVPYNHGLSLLDCHKIKIEKVCPNKNVTFWLYTKSLTAGYQIFDDEASILDAPFVHNKPIIFMLHGYTGDRTSTLQIRPNYLSLNYNVISIDYGDVAPSPCYLQAVENSDQVAKCGAQFIKNITVIRHIDIGDFHVVGFSLGGQIAGRMGIYLKQMGKTLHRITGLDPAGPPFYLSASFISAKSAEFVDVIHSNAGVEGKLPPVGKVDFYMNGVAFQNGCGLNAPCSHVRALQVFGESILKDSTLGFYGKPDIQCNPDDLVIMGEYVPFNASGKFYVQTNDKAPYGLGKPC